MLQHELPRPVDLVDAYANAAADAKRLGFDGIELHAAHGYLIDQFFWERTNRRRGRYGGDLVARTRFAVEIVKACRRRPSADFPIVLRLNLAGWARGLTGKPTITVGSVGLDNEFTSSLREGKPAANVGLDAVLEMLERRQVDLIAVGRALLVDPAWAEKVRDDRDAELQSFTPEALKTLS